MTSNWRWPLRTRRHCLIELHHRIFSILDEQEISHDHALGGPSAGDWIRALDDRINGDVLTCAGRICVGPTDLFSRERSVRVVDIGGKRLKESTKRLTLRSQF